MNKQVTLHQGAIETIFLDSMNKVGLGVSRPAVPISLQLSEDGSVRVSASFTPFLCACSSW